jgi:ribonucleotide monophosphatase NagD (HAD superfamily)
MFDLLIKEHKLEDEPLSKFVMVGDSLETDIKFGNNCGIDTLLVLTGNTSAK